MMIGKNIYTYRIQKKLTLSELADRAGISKSYLSNIERNLNQNPSIQVLSKIALVLEVDLESLIKNDANHEQPLDEGWQEIVNELKDSGIGKDNLDEYRTLIEFIKWKNQHIETKN
ncbi:MAG: helix-turn-helix domain-containing protein [Heyndrickxia sp.]